MGTSKTIGEASALLEPLGFRLEGVNAGNHYIFRDAETGAVTTVGTAAMVSKKHRANIVSEAQRKKRHAQSVSHRWVAWLLDRYDVGDTEEKQVTIPISRLGEQFLAANPDIRGTSRGLWRIALLNSKQAELVTNGRQGVVGAASVWKLRGPLFGVKPVPAESNGTAEDPAITKAREKMEKRIEEALEPVTKLTQMEEPRDRGLVDAESRSEPGADRGAGDLPRDSDAGAGGGAEGAESRTEDAGAAEGRVDEAPVVGTRGRAARTGPVIPANTGAKLSIPDDLAVMLSEHFSGDLRAENELLRSALDQALDALQGATQTLHAAVALTNERRVGKHRGMGPKNLRRWELMREYRTELDGPLTAEKLHRFFVEHGERSTHAVAANVLWTLDHNGLLRRGDAAGVYLWL